jgi:hypothetical protein
VSWLLLLAPHILYIDFDGAAIMGGTDCSDATKNCSSLIGATGSASVPSWSGSASDRAQVMAEVTQMYAKFNVQLVTARPSSTAGDYSMTVVGGIAQNINQPADRVGVAPLDCYNQNEKDISFVFAATPGLTLHDIAVAIAQESAHGYGLAHTDNRMDVMYPYISSDATGYLDLTMGVYDTAFVNSDCDGTHSQNSFRRMMFNVGHSGGPDTTPPTISISMPHDGDTVASGFTIVFDANDDILVAEVDYTVDGMMHPAIGLPPFQSNIASGTLSPGMHRIAATATDLDGNTAAQTITVNVKAVGQSPGDLGSACSQDKDCNGGGLCESGTCTHQCGTATTTCAAGFECGSANGLHVCVRTDQGGCSVGGHTAGGGVWVLLALLAAIAGSRCVRSA